LRQLTELEGGEGCNPLSKKSKLNKTKANVRISTREELLCSRREWLGARYTCAKLERKRQLAARRIRLIQKQSIHLESSRRRGGLGKRAGENKDVSPSGGRDNKTGISYGEKPKKERDQRQGLAK